MSYFLVHFEVNERYIVCIYKDAYTAVKQLQALKQDHIHHHIMYGVDEVIHGE